ncbi:MAG: DUF2293 domain-containing protein [bacterium]
MSSKPKKKTEIKVFISTRESKCDECGEDLGRKAWIALCGEEKGALCLTCADLDHLVFLPSGDAALTRRARKHSKLAAVVLKWSRARKQYERQGLLVEEEALERAEEECEADEDVRQLRRERAAVRRAELDKGYMKQFAARVRELYPYCPRGREKKIAEHACRKHSGRVGRTAAAKEFHEEAVRLAVIAHIRHQETDYDELILNDFDREGARERVWDEVSDVLDAWRSGTS